jgi:hypothetical protein
VVDAKLQLHFSPHAQLLRVGEEVPGSEREESERGDEEDDADDEEEKMNP